MNSFFLDFSFTEKVSGFGCTCAGSKIYNVDYYESVDALIDDAQKLLKKQDGNITFQCFTGFETIDLLRLFRDYDGTLTACHWKYNKSGYVSEQWQETQLKNNRASVKKYVLDAIALFRDREAA
jgi:hypothetical protein